VAAVVRHELLEIDQLLGDGLELLVPHVDGLFESLEATDVHGRADDGVRSYLGSLGDEQDLLQVSILCDGLFDAGVDA
jgi:hypothetical protein